MPGENPFFVGHRLMSDALATISSALSTSLDSPSMAADGPAKTAQLLCAARTTLLVE
jgi:hypothetical protein